MSSITIQQHKKRDDLQCWRAIAIIGVLAFHIWPEKFPNGFLGVDIFFVISGFLMAMLFASDKKKDFSLMNFYFRRIKRIVPIFACIILLTLLFLKITVFRSEYPTIIQDAKQSIFFISNYYDFTEELAYFEIRSSYRFFRHCWSLAVEMQFYLIFPLIVYLKKYVNYKIYFSSMLVLCFVSYFFQLTSTNSILQYEFTLFRLWQFGIGILAQSITFRSNILLRNFLFAIVISLIFLPFSIERMILSPIVLLATSLIIIFSEHIESNGFSTTYFASIVSEIFVFIGNISYLLYLIHWPVTTFARHVYDNTTFNLPEGLILCLISISIAIVIHYVLEKTLISFSENICKLTIVLIVIYGSIVAFIATQHIVTENEKVTHNTTMNFFAKAENFSLKLILPQEWSRINDLEAAERIKNDIMSFGKPLVCKKNVYINIERNNIYVHQCDMVANPKANMTALLIGNSFARNVIKAITSNPAFKRLILIYGSACSFPHVGPTKTNHKIQCNRLTKIIKDSLVYYKPDIVYLVQFLGNQVGPLRFDNNPENLRIWKETFEFVQKYTSAIIMSTGKIEHSSVVVLEYLRRRFYGLPINLKTKIEGDKIVMADYLKKVNCTKCFFFDYRDAFCKNGICDAIDDETHLPLFRDKLHISIFGLRKLKIEIDKATQKALDFIDNKNGLI